MLTGDAVLDGDLVCSGSALVIGGDAVTLDLAGHRILSLDGTGVGVDASGGFDGLTIKNGVIEGFEEGILAVGVDGLLLTGLSVLGATAPIPSASIHVVAGADVTIRNSFVSLTTILPGPHAIRFDSVEAVMVDGVEIDGGFVGVSFFSPTSGVVDPADPPTNGTVRGCRLTNNYIAILLAHTTDALIEENEISAADQGVRIGLEGAGVANVRIKQNDIADCAVGIHGRSGLGPYLPLTNIEISENGFARNGGGLSIFRLKDSAVRENVLTDSGTFGILLRSDSTGNSLKENYIAGSGVRGIVLLFGANNNLLAENIVTGSGSDGISLFVGANVGNVIRENVSIGNDGFDLFHNVLSTPNLWQENVFATSQEEDIGDSW